MILTGKSKEEFFSKSKYTESIFKELPILYQNALIIEWLDSVEIIIIIENLAKNFFSFQINHDVWMDYELAFKTRLDATIEAIKSAVKIYNEKHI